MGSMVDGAQQLLLRLRVVLVQVRRLLGAPQLPGLPLEHHRPQPRLQLLRWEEHVSRASLKPKSSLDTCGPVIILTWYECHSPFVDRGF